MPIPLDIALNALALMCIALRLGVAATLTQLNSIVEAVDGLLMIELPDDSTGQKWVSRRIFTQITPVNIEHRRRVCGDP
jgi:hypothetical protein